MQLYLKFPDEKGAPRVALRGFQRVHLEPGATHKVHFDLKPRDLGMVTENGNPIKEITHSASVVGSPIPEYRA